MANQSEPSWLKHYIQMDKWREWRPCPPYDDIFSPRWNSDDEAQRLRDLDQYMRDISGPALTSRIKMHRKERLEAEIVRLTNMLKEEYG